MGRERATLIVSGVARSGTTALAKMLNSHERICLGVERFKFQYLREHNFSDRLFRRDRFFDFRPEDTNLRPEARPAWADIYNTMRAKWASAHVVGDKVPDMMPVLPEFIAQNPDYKYIYILRNLKDVGLSWQARAQRVSDSWPKRKGFAAACISWAEQMEALHAYLQDGEARRRVLLLDYDRMYLEPDLTERAILKFLDIRPSARMRDVLTSDAQFFAARAPTRVPPLQGENYKSVDMAAFQALKRISVTQIMHLSDQGAEGPVDVAA